jgi:hypothetical protein
MVTPPTGPKPPAGPGTPPKPTPQPAAKPTQVPVTVALPDGKPATGVVRTRSANIIERVGWTLGEAFVGSFIAVFFGAQQLGLDVVKAAAIAGGSASLAALGAFVKNLITTRLEG